MNKKIVKKDSSLRPLLEINPELSGLWKMSALLLESGLVPKSLNTREKVFFVLLNGWELGLKYVQSITQLYPVVNKETGDINVGMRADLAGFLVHRAKISYEVLEWSYEKCVIQFSRNGEKKPPVSYSMEDAKRANLLWKVNWKRYPKEMLRARCLLRCARIYAPDVLQGMYSVEELEEESKEPIKEKKIIKSDERDEDSTVMTSLLSDITKAKTEAKLESLLRKADTVLRTEVISVEEFRLLESKISEMKEKLTSKNKKDGRKKAKANKS